VGTKDDQGHFNKDFEGGVTMLHDQDLGKHLLSLRGT
jgi:hypothetical protein